MHRMILGIMALVLVTAACTGQATPTSTVATQGTPSPETSTSSGTATSTTAGPTTTTTPATTTTAAPPGPVAGGEVVVGEDQFPITLNPFVPGGDDFIVTVIGQAHMAGAWDVAAETREMIPELATEIPSIDNGAVTLGETSMTVQWQIRDEAVWSDGRQITGDDFAFSAIDIPALSEECGFEESNPVSIEYSVADVGEKTISLEFASPTLEYEKLFEWVVPRHAVAGSDFCNDWNDVAWPSAGPFVVEEFVSGESVTLVRNDKYWKTDTETEERLPYLDGVVFRFMADVGSLQDEEDSLLGSFRSRGVDVIQPPARGAVVDALSQLEGEGAEVSVVPGPVWEHLNFQFGPDNRNPETLNALPSYRQAIAYAIDEDALAAVGAWAGLAQPAYSFVEFYTPAATSEPWLEYSYDPAKALDALAEACAAAGRDCASAPPIVVFTSTSNGNLRPEVAEVLEEQLEAVGFDVVLDMEDSRKYLSDTLLVGTYDLGMWAWVGSAGGSALVDLYDFFDPDNPPPEGTNYYRWGTPGSGLEEDEAVNEFRDLLVELRLTPSRDTIFEVAEELEDILASEVVVIPVAGRPLVGAVWADQIGGYVFNPTAASHTWNIERWYRVDL